MVDHALLLKDLQGQVKLLETDLRERSEDPTAIAGTGPDGTPETFAEALDREYQRARKAERTDATYGAWRDDQVTQAAVAWVLATVFVRFCEDNGLLEYPFIAGPRDGDDRYAQAMEFRDAWILEGRRENPDAPERTDRDWLEHAFAEMSVSSVMAGLFSREYNPMWKITPSHQAAQALIDFWRTVGDDGHLVHDFRDPEWNTRFLGDLYQDLSEATRKKYALLQTPEFVEEFILDYTLEPAVEEFGLDGKRIYQEDDRGFRLIDPTCGSGHFLLGAFHRLLKKWREAEPGASDWDLISRALRSVHGVDKNPYAVAIARFRLMIAAMREGGITCFAISNPEWPIVVATGDALLHGRGAPGMQQDLINQDGVHVYSTEDVGKYIEEYDILRVSSYHVAAGNPPYITVKDKSENANYRKGYKKVCSGKYALSAPFAKRFFDLAVRTGSTGVGAGFVGQITANSFARREFGKRLIEDYFFTDVDLTHVVDSSGAYIPGHGTPTIMLFGRSRVWRIGSKVRVLLGVQGEKGKPEDPARGDVWFSIVSLIKSPGVENEWVEVRDMDRRSLMNHPWSLGGGGKSKLKEELEKDRIVLGSVASKIGFTAISAEDDAFFFDSPRSIARQGGEVSRPLVTGDAVRDYSVSPATESIWPYDSNLQRLPEEEVPGVIKMLWPNRELLRKRKRFGRSIEDLEGIAWYEYSEVYREKLRSPLSIAFAFVATHNHFSLDRGGKVFKQSAPVIKLPEEATEQQYQELLGVLNTSTACFWLKQVSHDKGSQGVNEGFKTRDWERFFEFTSTKLKDFPLPGSMPAWLPMEIDRLAREVLSIESNILETQGKVSGESVEAARVEASSTHRRIIALQEELDWEIYGRYGLLSEEEASSCVLPCGVGVPEVSLGERAFEIVMARHQSEKNEGDVEWFSRHGSSPKENFPEEWPEIYKNVVSRRIEVIASNVAVRLIEAPEFKRRWQAEPWEKKQRDILKNGLLDRCEDRRIWFHSDSHGDERPALLSVRALSSRLRDVHPEVMDIAAVYSPDKDFAAVIEEVVASEHAAYFSALRFKESGVRKRADWEHVWDLQREEDRLNANLAEGEEGHRLDIPLPPRYISADFRKPSYWRNRGKLDVPKERFISYEGAETDEDPTLILGWAGWNHAEQADALASLAFERIEQGWRDDAEKMTPLLAGIAELLPWVRQWHSEPDETGESPADIVEEDLKQLREETGITDSDMKNWRPTSSGRGKRKKK